MVDIIFRAYDIRGIVGTEWHIDEVPALVHAIVYYFKKQNSAVRTLVIGSDARVHSPAIKAAAIRALVESGIDVIDIGECPSPVLYFALHTLSVDAGLMITASHNPAEYNGIKICLGTYPLWGEQVYEIRDLYKAEKKITSGISGVVTQKNIIDDYCAWLQRHFAHLKSMDLPVVIDCGNGMAGPVLNRLVESMQWPNVQLLYADPDGTFPNHEADPVKEKNMAAVKKIVTTTDAVVGIGLDGDVDRMAAMTKEGVLVPGDQLLALFAQSVLQRFPQAHVVIDIKSSGGLIELLDRWHAHTHLSPSGHAIIKNRMRENNALLAGELSCHFFFKDRYFGYDDGIYAMLRLFEILVTMGQSLSSLLTMFPKKWSSPEVRIECAEERKKIIISAVQAQLCRRDDVRLITIDGVRASMPYGWGIIRASNTQPELTVRFESDSEQGLQCVQEDFARLLQPFFGEHIFDGK